MKENIIKVDYKEEMEQSYIDYAMSVIIQRALPDLRDGLKPVHRRILYAMDGLHLNPNSSFKKSARIVGDVLGKFHPHSDAAIYEAMVRMGQDFNTNHTLVKGQGNFGSIDGDPAAAMRYTEAKLEPLSLHILNGLQKDIVPFRENFDNSLKEPEVLPAKFFNLLVNGSTGIAVGMSTNIPPHNLREVNNACKAYLEDENITSRQLMKYIKGPDFPTGGVIVNKDELAKIYETGNGRIRIRAKFDLEELKGGRKNLIITEIPYTFAGNKTKLIEDLIELVASKKLDELSDVRDESSKDGTRIVLEVKRSVDIEMLKLKLFQISRLEDTIPVNMLSIVDNRPKVLSLEEMMGHYVNFLIDINKNEFNYDLKKLEDEKEIKEGLIQAYNIIDLIIEIIRASKTRQDVFNCLTKGDTSNIKLKTKSSLNMAKKLNFTERQAESILKMQLQSLVSLEINKLKDELESINEKIVHISSLLLDENKLKAYIARELDQLKEDFGKNRRTKITQVKEEEEFKEEIIIQDVYALIDRFNYVKIIDQQSYSRTNEDTLKAYRYIISLKSNESIWIFADDCNFYQLKLEELPMSKMADRGTPLPNSLNILHADSQENLKDKELLFTTRNGLVKRVDSKEFETNRKTIIATKLAEDDQLIDVRPIGDDHEEILLVTKERRALRFKLEEVSKQKRIALGVIGINLNQADYVERVDLDLKTNKNKRSRGAKGEVLQLKLEL